MFVVTKGGGGAGRQSILSVCLLFCSLLIAKLILTLVRQNLVSFVQLKHICFSSHVEQLRNGK